MVSQPLPAYRGKQGRAGPPLPLPTVTPLQREAGAVSLKLCVGRKRLGMTAALAPSLIRGIWNSSWDAQRERISCSTVSLTPLQTKWGGVQDSEAPRHGASPLGQYTCIAPLPHVRLSIYILASRFIVYLLVLSKDPRL